MKRISIILLLTIAVVGGFEARPHESWHLKISDRCESEGNVGIFYSSLSPYGEWVDCRFGRAWRPTHATTGWRPYLYGQWVWSDFGWYWVSSEPFGWATFHYGRWNYDDFYGWIWIPDDVWGPAWVEWRYDDDYIGWAPLTPYATFSINVGISFSNSWVTPIHYWNFVSCRNFTSPSVVEYIQPLGRTRRIFGTTRGCVDIRAEGNRIINRGIDVGFVERRTNMRVHRVEVVQRDRANGEHLVREVNRERVEAYRPRLDGRTRVETTKPPMMRRGGQRIGAEGDRMPRESIHNREKDRTSGRQIYSPQSSGKDAWRQEGEVREHPLQQRKVEPIRPPERAFRPERQGQSQWPHQDEHPQQWQQRPPEKFPRDNHGQGDVRRQSHHSEVRESLQPVQRPEKSRGGRERGHRP